MVYNNLETPPKKYQEYFQITEDIWNKMQVLPTFSNKKTTQPIWTPDKGDENTYTKGLVKYVPTHEEFRAFWRDLVNSAEGKKRMAIKPLGEYPMGYPLELLIFTKTADNKPLSDPDAVRAMGKPVVWLQGPIHGNEQVAGDGIAWIAYSLATGEWDKYLEKVSVVLLPRINADGGEMQTRGSNIRDDKVIYNPSPDTPDLSNFFNVNTNIDMNRDNLWFDMPTLRAVHIAFNAYMPEVAVDHHEYGYNWNYFGGYEASMDANGQPAMKNGRVQLLVQRDAAGNPELASNSALINIAPPDPRKATWGIGGGNNMYSTWDITLQHGDHLNNPRSFQTYWTDIMEPAIHDFLAARGINQHHYLDGAVGSLNPDQYAPYYTGKLDANNNNIPDGTGIPAGGNEGAMFDPAHMFNALPLYPCLSALSESKNLRTGFWAWPKRVYSQYSTGEAMIAYAAEHANEVKKLVGDMRDKLVERGKTVYANSTDTEDKVYNLMKMVKRTIKDELWLTASGDEVTLPTAFWHTREAEPVVYRVRPAAYILPYTKTNADVAKRLTFNGAQVEVLNKETTVEVEDFGAPKPMASKRYHDNARRIVIAPSDAVMNNATLIRDPKLVPWSPNFWVEDKPNTLPVKTVTVPKGSFVVYMSQVTQRWLATVMEPDAERSFTRWSMALKEYADPTVEVCVPYRYMKEERLDTTPLYVAYPQVTGGGLMELEVLSGTELETLATSDTFKDKEIVVAETLYSKVSGVLNISFSFLTREELKKQMPTADFYFWNYNTESYDLVKRNEDGNVSVTSDYIGPITDEYGIHPIKFVAVAAGSGSDSGSGGGGCATASYAFWVLLIVLPLLLRRRWQAV
ncbi:MAG: hypothetical protein LBP21_03195 [Synergistaceae bacterium]|jgi:hypothetical protein|nr:hypothetical protein [Synergistaceae bacterium]